MATATAAEKDMLMNELALTLNDAAKLAKGHSSKRTRKGEGEWVRFKLTYMRDKCAFDMRRPPVYEKLMEKVKSSYDQKELTMLYGDMRMPVTNQEALDTAVRIADECQKSVYMMLSKHGAHLINNATPTAMASTMKSPSSPRLESTPELPNEGPSSSKEIDGYSIPQFGRRPMHQRQTSAGGFRAQRRHHSKTSVGSRTGDLYDVPYASSIASSHVSSTYLGVPHIMADPHNRHFMHHEPSRASSSSSSGLQHDIGSAGHSGGMQSPVAPTNWRQGRLLGAGSFGHVYICYDADTGADLAVKRILVPPDCDSKEVAAVEKELGFLQSVGRSHPRIVQFMGVQREHDSLCIFMERLDGTIKDEIKANGPLTDTVSCKYTAQVLDALNFLHIQAHVIHRDIKSTNILRDGKGNVKVSDFGSCKQLEEASGVANMDTFTGTIHYMAPEKAASKPLTSAVDIWSLGCTLMEMLTGHPPWYEFEAVAAILKIVSQAPPMNLPDGTRETTRIMLTAMLTRDPKRRPNAAQLLEYDAIRHWPQCTPDMRKLRDAQRSPQAFKRPVPILHAPPISMAHRTPNPNTKHTLI